MDLKDFFRASYRILGDYVSPYKDLFYDVDQNLTKAGFNYTLVEYVSAGIATAFTSFLVLTVIFNIVLFMRSISFVNFFFATLLSMILSFVILVLFIYLLPSYIIGSRSEVLEGYLPYAVLHMKAIAGGNVSPTVLFKVISQFDEYGDLSFEMRKIVEDVELAGYDIVTALDRAAARSPSENLKKLYAGIASTIQSGADLRMFLGAETEGYVKELRRKEEEYGDVVVGLFAEIYMIGFGLVPIFVSIMFAVMSVLRNVALGEYSIVFLQKVMAFIGIPVATVVFILILDSVRPVHLRVR